MKTVLAIVAAFCLGACSASQLPPVTQAPAPTSKEPAAARELIARGAVVIDVRTAEEYASEHLPRAINIPVQELPGRIAVFPRASWSLLGPYFSVAP